MEPTDKTLENVVQTLIIELENYKKKEEELRQLRRAIDEKTTTLIKNFNLLNGDATAVFIGTYFFWHSNQNPYMGVNTTNVLITMCRKLLENKG